MDFCVMTGESGMKNTILLTWDFFKTVDPAFSEF